MKTFDHRKRTRERSTIPNSSIFSRRAQNRMEKRSKARAMKKAMRAAKRAENSLIVKFHF